MRWVVVALSWLWSGSLAWASARCELPAGMDVADLPLISIEEEMVPQRLMGTDGRWYVLADLAIELSERFAAFAREQKGGVRLAALEVPPDRWGRVAAIPVGADGRDLSHRLVLEGIAIVRPQLRGHNCLKSLINFEAAAREKKAGVWMLKNVIKDYRSIDYAYWGTYWILEGRVASVGRTRSRLYLNFAERWTEDLTGIIQRKHLEEFEGFGHALSQLDGRRVRLRGVLQMHGGPELKLDHPAQLQLLD